jgi:hypothetical protein
VRSSTIDIVRSATMVVMCSTGAFAGCSREPHRSNMQSLPRTVDAGLSKPTPSPVGASATAVELTPGALRTAAECAPCSFAPSSGSAPLTLRFESTESQAQLSIAARNTTIQRLDVTVEPGDDVEEFKVGIADINFDGAQDLYLITSAGAANAYASYWLFQPTQQRFESIGAFPVFSIVPARRVLTTYERQGHAGRLYESCEYQIENGRPVLWKRERQVEKSPGTYEKTIAIRRGGQLEVTERKRVASAK